MKRSPKIARWAACRLASLAFISIIRVGFAAGADDASVPLKDNAVPNPAPQIECTTPDGRVSAVPDAKSASKNAAALLTGAETLSCTLQEGQTIFVIKLPEVRVLDRFTFVNENAGAAGEMKIAVSNVQLPAASPQWVDVDGRVAFNHKRLFNLSMVGVEARYLRLSFNVGKGSRLAAADFAQ